MLKIKDDIDLKELEKFGFKFEKTKYWSCYQYESGISRNLIIIGVDGRTIDIFNDTAPSRILDKLYDLIKADMVEKVVK